MAEEDESSKTEEPTEKKLSKAKDEGQVTQSQEIKSWASFFVSALFVAMLGPFFAQAMTQPIVKYFTIFDQLSVDQGNLLLLFDQMLFDIGIVVLPLMIGFTAAALIASIFQTGLIWAPKKIEPKLSNISLNKGVKKIVSSRSVMEMVKTIFKMSFVGAVAFGVLYTYFFNVELQPGFDITQLMELMYDITVWILILVTALMTIIAALDYTYQRYMFMKQMKMTKQEVKDEHKQAEGDPQVKAKIRQLRMERARQRMMASVPTADVVITNPTHFACALAYDQEMMTAPKLVAKGMDNLAFRIREVAEDNEVPIVENPPLARALYATVEIDEEIPPEHYAAVAEVIGFVMRLKGRVKK